MTKSLPCLCLCLTGALFTACGNDVPTDVDLGSPDAATTPPDLSPPPPRYDWVGVVGTGQSLSVGVAAATVLSKTQPFHNLKLLDSGADPKYPLDGSGKLSLVPLVEPIRPRLTGYADDQYPNNIYGETPHTAMASQLSALALSTFRRDYVTIHSVVGWSGHPIGDIDKVGGKRAYLGMLMEAQAIKKLADTAGKSFAYGAVTLTHGETDSQNANYAAAVYQLYKDYNTDLKAITGQTENIPFLISQQSTLPSDTTNRSISAVAVWQLGVAHPGEIICIGPKYQYPYATDNLHMTAGGYRRLGEKNAQVFYQAVMLGQPWHPLQPQGVSRSGTTITVTFAVPVAPLAWEETLNKPHQTQLTQWAAGRGFEVEDSTGPQTISAVNISGSSVVIQLAKAPTGTALMVRYAMTQDVTGLQGGQDGGRHGQLRDSDPFVGTDHASANCQIQDGSSAVNCSADAALIDWVLPRDLAEGSGLAPGTVVTSVTAAGKYTLSQPWKGPGPGAIQFRHDHRNYAVHFELPVP